MRAPCTPFDHGRTTSIEQYSRTILQGYWLPRTGTRASPELSGHAGGLLFLLPVVLARSCRLASCSSISACAYSLCCPFCSLLPYLCEVGCWQRAAANQADGRCVAPGARTGWPSCAAGVSHVHITPLRLHSPLAARLAAAVLPRGAILQLAPADAAGPCPGQQHHWHLMS